MFIKSFNIKYCMICYSFMSCVIASDSTTQSVTTDNTSQNNQSNTTQTNNQIEVNNNNQQNTQNNTLINNTQQNMQSNNVPNNTQSSMPSNNITNNNLQNINNNPVNATPGVNNTQVNQNSSQNNAFFDKVKNYIRVTLKNMDQIDQKDIDTIIYCYKRFVLSILKRINNMLPNNMNFEEMVNIWNQALQYQYEIEVQQGNNTIKQQTSNTEQINKFQTIINNCVQSKPDDIKHPYSLNSFYEMVKNYLIDNMLCSKDWTELVNEYLAFIDKLIKIAKEDKENKENKENKVNNEVNPNNSLIKCILEKYKSDIINHLLELQEIIDYNHGIKGIDRDKTPFLMNNIQEGIEKISFADMIEFSKLITADNCPMRTVINNAMGSIENDASPLDYIVYYINTNNPWGISYARKNLYSLFNGKYDTKDESGNVKKGIDIIREAINKMPDDKNNPNAIKNRYANIFAENNIRNEVKRTINELIDETMGILKELVNELNKAKIAVAYCDCSKLIRAMKAKIYELVDTVSVEDQKFLLGDMLNKMWQLFNENNVIDKMINAAQQCNDTKFKAAYNELYNTLTNDDFKKTTDFEKFTKMIEWYKNADKEKRNNM